METVLCFIFLLMGDEYEGSLLFCSLSFMYMDVLSTCISVHHMLTVCKKAGRGHHIARAGVADGYELSCGWRKSNLGPPAKAASALIC